MHRMLRRYLGRQQPAPRAIVGGFDEYDFCEIPSDFDVSAASQALQTALANDNTSASPEVQVSSNCAPEIEGFQVAEEKLEPEHVASCSAVKDLPPAHPEAEAEVASGSPTEQEAEADAETMGNAMQTENETSGAALTTSTSTVPSGEELDTAARALQAMSNQAPKNAPVTSTSAEAPRFLASRASNPAVAYCLDLFQRDPQVQAAVVSLARDPAVWDAFISNEKVQELLKNQSKSKRNLLIEGHPVEFLRYSSASNPFFVALHYLMSTLWGLMNSMVEVVHGVFGFFDKKLFGGNDPTDHPVKATMVLTILLLALILLSR